MFSLSGKKMVNCSPVGFYSLIFFIFIFFSFPSCLVNFLKSLPANHFGTFWHPKASKSSTSHLFVIKGFIYIY